MTTMKVFLSHSVSPHDAPVAARLRAVAATYDITLLLPEREHNYRQGRLTAEVRKQIRSSDAVIALATINALWDQSLALEISEAAQAGKPIIALVEFGVATNNIPTPNIVHFNRHNPTAHDRELVEVLKRIQSQIGAQQVMNALGWIAGIALGLVALNAVAEAVGPKK
ncbi:MAG: hypothetical protein KIT57_07845 [Blastocatellales bacterium]|nr:hypothetical protein [Blastocatellales bacterium]